LKGIFKLLLRSGITPEGIDTHPPQARALLRGVFGKKVKQHGAVVRRGDQGHLALKNMGLKASRSIPPIKAGCCAARMPAERAAPRVEGAEEVKQVGGKGVKEVGRGGKVGATARWSDSPLGLSIDPRAQLSPSHSDPWVPKNPSPPTARAWVPSPS
jgi:hypothetical protein